jgi:hypothetical protein
MVMVRCSDVGWARLLCLAAVMVLLPVVSSAQWYAQSVVANSPSVTGAANALLHEDGSAAQLPPATFITLDMSLRYGDVCTYWDVFVVPNPMSSNNIKVELSDDQVTWMTAELFKTGPYVWADMPGPAWANYGKRWQYARITNLELSGGLTVGIDAVGDCFAPGIPPPAGSASTVFAEPYAADLCLGPTQPVPGIGPYGTVGLIGLILLGGAVAIVLKTRRSRA